MIKRKCDSINNNCLEDSFSELLKLVYFIVTVPATSSSEECAFSAIRRIHTLLRNIQEQDRLTELSMIEI